VAFSPDGKTLASGSYDCTIRLWDMQSGSSIGELTGHSYSVLSVAFSPDGKTLASGSYDCAIRLWDVQSGSSLRELSGHLHIVTSVAFSPDGKTLASGSYDCTIRLWGGDVSMAIQDAYKVWQTKESMNTKWGKIRAHIDQAMVGSPECLYINFTSGAEAIFPYLCAYKFYGFFEWIDGQNYRTYKYLKQCYKNNCPPEGRYIDNELYGRVGLILSDFPGAGLIDVIIAHNGLPMINENSPPLAVAKVTNGPYLADEGSPVTFDASGSTDAENDSMEYRWDVDGDEVFDTEWSSSPLATNTWHDDYEGVAWVEVHDGEPSHSDRDAAQVTVLNVAPTAAIDGFTSPVDGYILPGQSVSFSGSFTDPGCLDTHTAQWDFGDESTEPGTLTEENDIPDATGSVLDGHTYGEPGLFTVLLEILDDDGGIGTASIEVEIMTASKAVDFADSFIQDLPESCFKGQADNRKNAFSNKFKAVKNALDAGGIRGAINKLMNDIRAKADGSVDGKSSNDWITDVEAQEEICLVIDELVKYLQSLQDG
jgi:hypothetical protein